MRRSLTILAAAAFGVVGATASFGPALAAPLAAPAVLNQADTGDNIVQVRHNRKHHRKGRHHHRKRVVVKNYYYTPYAYYPQPRYYYPHYYSKPGVSLNFSFGGGGYHHW